ncbi:MAG TPA: hypothetical protein VHA78_02400 [Candidatus Peribacteraceae bacterium]|nr:hypothetical protein [Candidatus Peribacteraceae bacterium]
MFGINTAIEAFERNPTDDAAQDVDMEVRSSVLFSFFLRSEGCPVPPILFDQLERAHSVLQNVQTPTDLTRHYAASVLYRKDILLAHDRGDHATVDAMIKEALES